MSPDPIALHVPELDGREAEAAAQAVRDGKLQGGGEITARVEATLRERLGAETALLVTSCTHALETGFALLDLQPGDEVIIPSYSHPAASTAALRAGATLVFADSLPDSPNLDPADAAERITPRTRAIAVIHYGGISADLDALRSICEAANIAIIEDAAQAFDSKWHGESCGTVGFAGCISFHGTKSVVAGESGLLITSADHAERAMEFREMGTDRHRFRSGTASQYGWCGPGSSFLPSDVLASILAVQLEKADSILHKRLELFDRYREMLLDEDQAERLALPEASNGSSGNGHVFHIRLDGRDERERCRAHLAAEGISSAMHFQALHTTEFGRSIQRSPIPDLPNSRRYADGLLRLPMHTRLDFAQQDRVVDSLQRFLRTR